MTPRKQPFHTNEKGFTLVEVALSAAIIGAISGAVSMSIFQVMDANARGTTHLAVIQDVENAVHWITRDSQMAQSIDPTAPGGFPLTLHWVEWNNTVKDITYSLQNGQLQRGYS